jgi:hypothetical protein
VIREICYISETPKGPECDCLVEDAAALVQIFANLMEAKYLRLRFDVVDNDACRKFHVDTITAPLVCTCRGLGTQYGISLDGAEPPHVLSVPTGSPVLMRGRLWPDQSEIGVLHRSPPIAGTGHTRRVFVVDQISDPDNKF